VGVRYGRIGGQREKVEEWVDRWAEGEGKGGVRVWLSYEAKKKS
jgi:hypothetical protein